ncbi:hypothetical protein GCM10020254_15680 [Streptomyces goshikiensis]
MAADEVRGIQDQGLMATVKHFAANNQEYQRETIDATVDEQTLQEVELPAFRSAVKAGAASVMCSYNSVNGTHACSNEHLLQDVLREQWDFRGWVLSDWLATHATSDITKGLDQELGVELALGPAGAGLQVLLLRAQDGHRGRQHPRGDARPVRHPHPRPDGAFRPARRQGDRAPAARPRGRP